VLFLRKTILLKYLTPDEGRKRGEKSTQVIVHIPLNIVEEERGTEKGKKLGSMEKCEKASSLRF